MKKVLMFFAVAVFLVGAAGNASAYLWTGSITLSDAYDKTIGGVAYKAYDIVYQGGSTDTLDLLFVSLGYDTSDVGFSKMRSIPSAYYRNNDPEDVKVWENYGVPPFNEIPSLVYNIMGETPIGMEGQFQPVAMGDTLLFTALFTTVAGGNFDDTSVYFTVGGYVTGAAAELITVNGETLYNNSPTNEYMLDITADTIRAKADPNPVPIPGAIYLLGSGLIGLVGIRRRTV